MGLNFIFDSKSIAFCGIAKNPKSAGRKILENLISSGYLGKIFIVNPGAKKISHFVSYRQISDIASAIDLALIFSPESEIVEILTQCGEKKIKNVIIFSDITGDFYQSSLKNKIIKIAAKNQISTVGPGAGGIIDTKKMLQICPDKIKIKPGPISVINSSDSKNQFLFNLLLSEKIRLAKYLNLGRAWDIDLAKSLNFLENDKNTKLVMIWLDKNELSEYEITAFQKLVLKKPVIVFSPELKIKSQLSIIQTIVVNNLAEFFILPKIILNYPKILTNNLAIISFDSMIAKTAITEMKKYHLVLSPMIENPQIIRTDDEFSWQSKLQKMAKNKFLENILIILDPTNNTQLKNFLTASQKLLRKSKKNVFLCLLKSAKSPVFQKELKNIGLPYFDDLILFFKTLAEVINYYQYSRTIKSQTRLFFFRKSFDKIPLKLK